MKLLIVILCVPFIKGLGNIRFRSITCATSGKTGKFSDCYIKSFGRRISTLNLKGNKTRVLAEDYIVN